MYDILKATHERNERNKKELQERWNDRSPSLTLTLVITGFSLYYINELYPQYMNLITGTMVFLFIAYITSYILYLLNTIGYYTHLLQLKLMYFLVINTVSIYLKIYQLFTKTKNHEKN